MSLGQQTQAGVHSLVANTLGAAAGAAGGGPIASALVSGLVNLLWPASQADVWDSIRDDVQNLINQSLDADEVATIAATLTGLKKALADYNNEVNSPNPDAGGILQYYRITKETFDTNSPAFQKEGYQVLLLPQYAQMMNLYLALMRDGVLYGNTWKMPSDEVNINQTDLTAAVNAAVSYVNQWVPAGVPAPVIDPNASPQISSHAAATAYLTNMNIGVLDQQKLWPYFDPTQHAPGTLPPPDPREIFSDSFWRVPPGAPYYGNNANSLPSWGETEGILTSVTSWGDTRSTGVQSGYADGLQPMEGHDNGTSETAQLNVGANDPIVSATITTLTPSDDFIIPIFDKQVTLFTRSGQQVLLGVSNDPVHLNDLDMDVGADSINVHKDGFDDHVVSSVHLNYWAGVPLPFQSTEQSQGNRIAACNVVVGFRRWDSYAVPQTEWRWCGKCNTMFFAGSGAVSVCPSGGAHDSSHSVAYVLFQGGQPPESEIVWNWCRKCGCIYGPDGGWACAAGGGHDGTQSGRYAMLLKVADPATGMPVARTTTTQDGWYMCSKCSLLFNLAEQSKSCCAADKGQHTESGHPEYTVKYF